MLGVGRQAVVVGVEVGRDFGPLLGLVVCVEGEGKDGSVIDAFDAMVLLKENGNRLTCDVANVVGLTVICA